LNGSTALVGPRLFYSFPIYSIHNWQDSLNEWSAHRKASTQTLDGKWPIILLRGPLGAWGSLTCSKFTTRLKQLKVPPGGLVPWIFPWIRRPPPGLNPCHSSHEVGTLPLDYGGRCDVHIPLQYFSIHCNGLQDGNFSTSQNTRKPWMQSMAKSIPSESYSTHEWWHPNHNVMSCF
jgi:hypothetical protein